MPSRCPILSATLTPFLYPSLFHHSTRHTLPKCLNPLHSRCESTFSNPPSSSAAPLPTAPAHEHHHEDSSPSSRLNPTPSDYSRSIFADRATVTLYAGPGGHGCISFLREKYIAAGPANGGDGGSGGSVYIQAVRGETSLHKLARRRNIKAGRGRNGQGKTRGGERGEDVVVQVPVGTVVREVERVDPVAIEEERRKLDAGGEDAPEVAAGGGRGGSDGPYKWSREKWLLYPAITAEDIATAEFPSLPQARASQLTLLQAPAPISLDLSRPMDKPILLLAGAVGGLGNPHFITKSVPRPKYATKGADGVRITLELELKLLADVGLVGLPNAGKSTLLRALSNSRARVGDWAFTTLHPNIGTVVLDDHRGPALFAASTDSVTGERRTNFTVADIPGLVPDAHLDRGLGVSFLRHVERARVLAFVVDLGAGDAAEALRGLWREVGAYERLRAQEEKEKSEELVRWSPFSSTNSQNDINDGQESIVVGAGSRSSSFANSSGGGAQVIAQKPWFVVATKADLPSTQENFAALRSYLEAVRVGDEAHPSGQEGGWRERLEAIPVSAINGHGVERITEWTLGLLDQ